MKDSNFDIFSIIAAFLVALMLKQFYTTASHVDLLFILKPVNFLVELFTRSEGIWVAESGFFHENYNMIIERSCAGINFWAILFCTLVTMIIQKYFRISTKIGSFCILFILSFGISVFTNASRITIALTMLRFEEQIPLVGTKTFHLVEGTFVNLVMLILSAFLLKRVSERIILKREKNYA